MTGNEIAALVVAFTGVLGALFAGLRGLLGDRFKRSVDQSANILTGLNALVKTLQDELERVKADHRSEVERLEGRERRIREEYEARIRELEERIDELGTQVWALTHRSPDTRLRDTDRP